MLEKTKNIFLKLLGLVVSIGGLLFAVDQFDVGGAIQLAIVAIFIVVVAAGEALAHGNSTAQRVTFGILTCFALVSLIPLLPAAFSAPTGTVWDVIVSGWNALIDVLNTANDTLSSRIR